MTTKTKGLTATATDVLPKPCTPVRQHGNRCSQRPRRGVRNTGYQKGSEHRHAEHGRKIVSMYAKGMTTADIESHMQNIYDIEGSDSTISRITYH